MNNKLLILDLDETLIHGTESPLDYPADFQVGPFYIHERPHVRPFMDFCREHFTVAVWTTATIAYAEQVLFEICGHDYAFEFIWCRDRCTPRSQEIYGGSGWIKDLKKVSNRGWNLDDVLMLEDQPANLSRQYGNVIRIAPFFGDMSDVELELLMPFLLALKSAENVRKVEKRGWNNRFSDSEKNEERL